MTSTVLNHLGRFIYFKRYSKDEPEERFFKSGIKPTKTHEGFRETPKNTQMLLALIQIFEIYVKSLHLIILWCRIKPFHLKIKPLKCSLDGWYVLSTSV